MKLSKSRKTVPGKVSVIVASYNHAGFLEKRMNSLVNQTYKNMEIIVIDDCSPDNSVQILNKYKKNSKIKIHIHSENKGWIETSNEGISLATGEFVIFANCDDFSDLQQIEKLVSSISISTDVGMAFSKSILVNQHNEIIGDDFKGREKRFREYCQNGAYIKGPLLARFLMHSCVIPNLSALLIRKNLFEKCGLFSPDYKVCNDWEIFFRFAHECDCVYINEGLNYFRQHDFTIRNVVKDSIQLSEFFNILYSQIDAWDYSRKEKFRFRLIISQLWAYYIISNNVKSISSFKHHYKLSRKFNRWPILYLYLGTITLVSGVIFRKIFIKKKV